MTPEKAVKTIQVAIAEVEWNYPLDYAIAFETAIKALKKQVVKTPRENETNWAICPACGGSVYKKHVMEHIMNEEITFCEHCGQALDWRETE